MQINSINKQQSNMNFQGTLRFGDKVIEHGSKNFKIPGDKDTFIKIINMYVPTQKLLNKEICIGKIGSLIRKTFAEISNSLVPNKKPMRIDLGLDKLPTLEEVVSAVTKNKVKNAEKYLTDSETPSGIFNDIRMSQRKSKRK